MWALIQCNTAYLYHSASETYTEGNKEIRLKERHALLLRIIKYRFLIFKAEPNNSFSFSIIFLINRCLQVVKKIPSGILKANPKLFNVKPGRRKKRSGTSKRLAFSLVTWQFIDYQNGYRSIFCHFTDWSVIWRRLRYVCGGGGAQLERVSLFLATGSSVMCREEMIWLGKTGMFVY